MVPNSAKRFDPRKQLTWERIKFDATAAMVSLLSKTRLSARTDRPFPLLCPVEALHALKEVNGGVHGLTHQGGKTLMYPVFFKMLKQCIQQIGLDPNEYSAHSFCLGGCILPVRRIHTND